MAHGYRAANMLVSCGFHKLGIALKVRAASYTDLLWYDEEHRHKTWLALLQRLQEMKAATAERTRSERERRERRRAEKEWAKLNEQCARNPIFVWLNDVKELSKRLNGAFQEAFDDRESTAALEKLTQVS